MGWFDLPLFIWGIYSTALIQIQLATPVLGIAAGAADAGTVFRHRHFRSRALAAIRFCSNTLLLPDSTYRIWPMCISGFCPACGEIISELIPDLFATRRFSATGPSRNLQRVAGAGQLYRVGSHQHVRGGSNRNSATVIFSALTFLVAISFRHQEMFNWLLHHVLPGSRHRAGYDRCWYAISLPGAVSRSAPD